MKAILEFNLDEHDDKQAHLRSIKSLSMAIILWEMDDYLRGLLKHGELDDLTYIALKNTRNKLRELMNDNNIDLDELIN
jgi:hypothetical protein